MTKLTHMSEDGHAAMVDVSGKAITHRTAMAQGDVLMSQEAFHLAMAPNAKGNPVIISEIAGIGAAKKTSDLIPLCHPLSLSKIDVAVAAIPPQDPDKKIGFNVKAVVKTDGKTGVEMEALMAVSIACLTLYDMLKSVDKSIEITNIHLLEKSGGKSGHYNRNDQSKT